jgi:hypothetical protein
MMRKSEQDKDPSSENRVAMKTVYLLMVLAEFHLMREAKEMLSSYRHLIKSSAMCITLRRKPSKAKTYFASAME